MVQLNKDKFDPIHRPFHYNSSKAKCEKCGHQIQCIDITRHMGSNLANVLKYIWRCDLKDADVEDLEKARWYLNDEIKKREGDKNGKI